MMTYIVQSASTSRDALPLSFELVTRGGEPELDVEMASSNCVDGTSKPEEKRDANTVGALHHSRGRIEDAGAYDCQFCRCTNRMRCQTYYSIDNKRDDRPCS